MTKIRVDMGDLTLGELAAAGELLNAPLHEAMTGVGQPRAIAAIVCIIGRRDNPDYSLEQALQLHMRDVELVGAADPEAPAGDNGATPVLLPAPGA